MILASNFKTNHTRKSAREYLLTLSEFVRENNIESTLYIFLPPTCLDQFDFLPDNIIIGAQNGYPILRGSFTGEIGLEHLSEFNVKTILIGHSERRHILGETQELIAKKFRFFAEQGFHIVYCVGEPLEVKKQGLEATLAYIQNQYEGIDTNYEQLTIAYEPVWAIGTGISATRHDIRAVHTALKPLSHAPIIYGGSVNICSTEEILATEDVGGVLVGTASWVADDFCKMVGIAHKLKGVLSCS